MEKTLVLIKPDAVEQNIIGDIISHYEKAGLKINKRSKPEVIKVFLNHI